MEVSSYKEEKIVELYDDLFISRFRCRTSDYFILETIYLKKQSSRNSPIAYYYHHGDEACSIFHMLEAYELKAHLDELNQEQENGIKRVSRL